MKSIFTLTLLLFVTCCAQAQTFHNIYDFSGDTVGVGPYMQLASGPSNRLYGETYNGTGNSFGTVFGLKMDGTSFTNVLSFNYTDGAFPKGGVILSGNTLYGTTTQSASGDGTVFAVNTDGTGFTNLYTFSGPDGSGPGANLLLSGNTLYGTTSGGGSNSDGIVFAINTDSTGFTNLHNFTGHDGQGPQSGVIISGNTLYGATYSGGTNGDGSVFSLQTDGTHFTNLFNFHGYDGYFPVGSLVLSGGMLYGTTIQGGTSHGNVYGIHTDGSGFTNLYTFTGNKDGSYPGAGLVLSGHTLYGTASGGGSNNWGCVFSININGTGFAHLYDFTNGLDGGAPGTALLLVSNILYSTTASGGTNSRGTIFSITLPPPAIPPQMAIHISAGNLVVAWPSTATGYTLRSGTNLTSVSGWSAVTNTPVIVNGLYTVTNAIGGRQMFYYLSE